ncbi:MAG: glycosyltransferase [Actinomycetaceae bacterium]|nr:glycosyltransferase [Actinomycetaceae bacterium]
MTTTAAPDRTQATRDTGWETIQRVVFPSGDDPAVWPLYIDWGQALSSAAIAARHGGQGGRAGGLVREIHPAPRVHTRRSLEIPEGEHLSLATYFNAFPAAYWQRWTDVRRVRLDIEVEGPASISLMRSSARGTFNTIETRKGEGHMSFEVPLDRFGDGGWIWPEISAAHGDTKLVNAAWSVPVSEKSRNSKVTVGITTFNMADECVQQARRFLGEPEVLERIAEIVIADQGTKHVADAEGYDEVQEALGDKLRVIVQANLGGSGGFSRAMYETLKNPDSDYVLLLDDDAEIEPEGLLRAVAFADRALNPVIVGGQMLNLNERTILHSMGERIEPNNFWWDAVNPDLAGIDLAQTTIRNEPAMNRRIDVAYNGWWMCLIPKVVMEKIGLSLPFFIKWDDAEYGLRAMENGFRTVTLPGAAVWHVPWTEKDDGLDWQAYFHQRNRVVTALLHSPFKDGGRFPLASYASDSKHLLSLQYFAEHLRLRGLEDVFKGPAHLHPSILTRAAEGRAEAKEFPDAVLISDARDFPEIRTIRPAKLAKEPTGPRGRVTFMTKALRGALRQLKPVDRRTLANPEGMIQNLDARWWRLAIFDSALVSNAAGSGVWFYQRDDARFRRDALRSLRLHIELKRKWASLAAQYRAALPQVTSPEAWEKTFGI